ncbi:MAG TPA: hypothetical protein VFY87_21795, partial [Geminicoccaceae bacterium]|nr:hypothetical protein [Geminicoccaceae bacterium]
MLAGFGTGVATWSALSGRGPPSCCSGGSTSPSAGGREVRFRAVGLASLVAEPQQRPVAARTAEEMHAESRCARGILGGRILPCAAESAVLAVLGEPDAP